MAAMKWMDSAKPEEVEKWFPKYKQMFDEATKLERRMRREDEQRRI
jgi:hypothetical protein